MNNQYLWMPVVMLLSLPATAAEEPTGPWSGKVALGYLATSGNTDNTSLNTEALVEYAINKWSHALGGRAINSSQDNITTAESYRVDWNTHYEISDVSFAFGRLDWRKDKFAGFDTQFSQTAGYGRKVIDNDTHKLSLEIGAGAKQLQAADTVDANGNVVPGAKDNDFIVRGGLDYSWAFSDTASFVQGLIIESGQSNTFIESISAIKASLVGELALVASYTVRNNSDVPAGNKKTDTFTALSLEYGF